VRNFVVSSCLFFLGGSPLAARNGEAKTSTPGQVLSLTKGWRIQSSTLVTHSGDKISSKTFDAQNWYPATVPTTVLAALVKVGKYPDPYVGTNLRSIPGTTYPIGAEFSNLPMSSDSPFSVSWWYRTEFSLPGNGKGKSVWLHLDGLNYRANVWLNGRQVASSDQVAGAWRLYELNVSQYLLPAEMNVLAIEVFPAKDVDLAIDFVDWNPAPPDKDMGLWQEVVLSATGPVSVRHATIETRLDLPATETAHLTVRAELTNASVSPVQGTLRGVLHGAGVPVEFSQPVELAPSEKKEVVFSPDTTKSLNLSKPKLWWPYQMGEPYLYTAFFHVDMGKCIGCKCCVVACNEQNGNPAAINWLACVCRKAWKFTAGKPNCAAVRRHSLLIAFRLRTTPSEFGKTTASFDSCPTPS